MLLPPSAHRHHLSCVCSSNTTGRSRMCSLQVFDCRRRPRLGAPLQLQQGGTDDCCPVWYLASPPSRVHPAPRSSPHPISLRTLGANGIVVWLMSMLLSCCERSMSISRAPRGGGQEHFNLIA